MATSAYEAIANPDEPHVQSLAPWAVKRWFVLAVVGAMGVLCGLVFWSGVSSAPEPNGINGPQGGPLVQTRMLPYTAGLPTFTVVHKYFCVRACARARVGVRGGEGVTLIPLRAGISGMEWNTCTATMCLCVFARVCTRGQLDKRSALGGTSAATMAGLDGLSVVWEKVTMRRLENERVRG